MGRRGKGKVALQTAFASLCTCGDLVKQAKPTRLFDRVVCLCRIDAANLDFCNSWTTNAESVKLIFSAAADECFLSCTFSYRAGCKKISTYKHEAVDEVTRLVTQQAAKNGFL